MNEVYIDEGPKTLQTARGHALFYVLGLLLKLVCLTGWSQTHSHSTIKTISTTSCDNLVW